MKNGKIIKRGRGGQKLLSLLLALVMAFAALPLLSDSAYAAEPYTISITQSGNSVTVNVKCTNKNYQLDGIFLDRNTPLSWTSDQSFNGTFDLSKYGTGYHTVVVRIWNKKNNKLAEARQKKYIAVNTLTARPSAAGSFEVYSNYFNYNPYLNLWANRGGHLYMEISTNNRDWTRWDLIQANGITSNYKLWSKISGLRPNTTYYTRIRYGQYVTYPTYNDGDGKAHFFAGPVLNTGTIKTGKASKPAFKKVTAKAVHVKYHKYTRPGYYYWTGYHYIWMKPVKMRYYTYDVKVTVKFKKKPGTAGIWVTGPWGEKKWLAGNKKKYTTTFKGLYPHNISVKKPRGRVKTTIKVQTGQSKAYGGYSPVKSKRVKLK